MSGRELNLDRRLDELFAVPPDEFVRARDWLARVFKERGDAEKAAAVRALRRPTVAAWAVNRLVRMHRGDVKELISVGEDLRKAQRRALSGVGAGALREATDRRRRIESKLLAAAQEILEGRGGGSAIEDIASTLAAAVLDEGSARQVAEGRLVRPLEAPSAFDAGGGLSVVETVPDEDPEVAERRRHVEDLGAAAQATRREAREAAERARRAEEEAARLEEAAATAADRAAAARDRALQAAEAAERQDRLVHGAERELRRVREGGSEPD